MKVATNKSDKGVISPILAVRKQMEPSSEKHSDHQNQKLCVGAALVSRAFNDMLMVLSKQVCNIQKTLDCACTP